MAHSTRREAALVVIATAGTVIAIVAGTRGSSSGTDDGLPAIRYTQVVDRCGVVVRGSDGQPVVLAFDPVPPPLDQAVAAGTFENAGDLPDEDRPVVPIPADPRRAATVQLAC
jgi:hypothetical protein